MAVRIRLRRMGKKKSPRYRLAVVDSRTKRDGRFVEFVGFYDPTSQPYLLKLKEDRIFEWLRLGASLSDTVESLLRREGLLRRWHEMKTGQKVVPLPRQTAPKTRVKKASDKAEPEKTENRRLRSPRPIRRLCAAMLRSGILVRSSISSSSAAAFPVSISWAGRGAPH